MVLAGSPGMYSARVSPSADPLASEFDGLTWMQVARRRRSIEHRNSRLYAKAGEIWGTAKRLKPNRDIK